MTNLKEAIQFENKVVLKGGAGIGKSEFIKITCDELGKKYKIINTPHFLSYDEMTMQLNDCLEKGVEIFVFDEIQHSKLSTLEAIIEFANFNTKMIFSFSEVNPNFALPTQAAFIHWINTQNQIKIIEFQV